MVDIAGINSQPNQPNRITDRSASKTSSTKGKDTSSSVSSGDKVLISAGAKEAQSVSRLVAAAQAQPEIRAEEVAKAKERLANGEYEGVDVSRKTARKILGLTD